MYTLKHKNKNVGLVLSVADWMEADLTWSGIHDVLLGND